MNTDPEPEIPDDIDFADARRATFSEGFSFNGKQLEKLSPMRKRLFGEMRAACGAPPIGSPDAMLSDAIRVVWLCMQQKAALQRMMAGLGLTGPREASNALRMQMQADEWAELNERLVEEKDDENRSVIIELFAAMWTQVIASQPASDGESEDEGNGHGRRNRP